MSDARERAWAALRQEPQAGLAAIGPYTDAWSAWARAVLVMATGDYRRAHELLEPLTDSGDELAGLAAARLASGLRQVDDHDAAIAWDERAMLATGQAVIDGMVGRAADAVGCGDVEAATAHLAAAGELAATQRDEIRVAWVACEVALLQGQPPVAAGHAARAHRLSAQIDSPRHLVKSTLFWAAALRNDDPVRALDLLQSGYAHADSLALRPLLWPMVTVMGERAAANQVAAASDAVRYIAAHLPPGVGRRWLHRPDIVALGELGSPGGSGRG